MADTDWRYVQRHKTNGQYRTTDDGGGGASALADLTDVDLSNPTDGQIIRYDSQNNKWVNDDESGGTVTDVEVDGVSVVNGQGVAEIPAIPDEITDLSNVEFSNLQDHQPLRYNATSQKWVNGADSFPPLIYSDIEREIGVWRDGKPLYQKTYSFNATSSGATIQVDSNIDTFMFVPTGTFVKQTNSGNVTNYGFYEDSSNKCQMYYERGTNSIQVRPIYSSLVGPGYVTIQYTKTTDTAGSGTWTTQGTPTHHYSTSEQVIGTWIDGKPIYEKSFNGLSIALTRNAYVHSNIIISNLDKIISNPVAFDNAGQSIQMSVGLYSNKELALYCVSDATTLVAFTVRYTKITD